MQHFDLGALDGVPLGFTDGAARPDGSWLFSAAAEHSADSVADGPCSGSVVGEVSARGELVTMRRVAGTAKVEGIALQPDGPSICMVTDDDDPRAQRAVVAGHMARSAAHSGLKRAADGAPHACAIVAGFQSER